MERELRQEAKSALVGAAERLGVDPFRLARFLSNGRLADILSRLRASDHLASGGEAGVDLVERYLEFLDQEIEHRRARARGRGLGSGPPQA